MPDDEVDEYVLHFELEGFENVGQLMRITEVELVNMMKVAHLRLGHKKLIQAAWRVLTNKPSKRRTALPIPHIPRSFKHGQPMTVVLCWQRRKSRLVDSSTRQDA